MTDKELRKLRRDDLLQILINQQRQIDELTATLQRTEEALANRNIAIGEAGTLAEAAMKLNGVFDAAQTAADEYLAQMRSRADAMAAEAERQSQAAGELADSVVAGARSEADRILRQARSEAEAITRQARSEAEEITRQAGATPNAPEASGGDQGEGKRRRGLLWRNR